MFSSFGIGTMLVVAVAMIGSMTALPAMLSYLGQKGWTEKGRVPWVAKRRHANRGESRVWGAILTRVLERPLVSAVIAGGILVGLTIPALGMQFKDPGVDGYSRDLAVMKTYDRIQAAFPGGGVQPTTIVKAPYVTKPEVQAAVPSPPSRSTSTSTAPDGSSTSRTSATSAWRSRRRPTSRSSPASLARAR